MKEIIKINLNNARNGEHYQYHNDVLATINEEFAIQYQLLPLRTTYTALFTEEDNAYKQNQAYAKTKEIEECDRKRDDLFVFVRQTIDSGLYHPVPEKRAAAERLLFALKPYRMANQQPFAENTALVTNMTQDMLGKDYIDDVRLLDLEGPIKLLDEANNEFNTLYGKRSDEKLERYERDNMKAIRPKVDEAFRALTGGIGALYQVNELITHDLVKAEELGGVIDRVNALSRQLQETIARRRPKKGSPEPEPPAPEPENPPAENGGDTETPQAT